MATAKASRARSEPGFQLRDLPLDGDGPLYDQIYRSLRAAILDGRVSPGTRLPTSRALADELGLSRNTVLAAFEPLRAEGYVVSRVGAGTFVAPQVGAHAPARPGVAGRCRDPGAATRAGPPAEPAEAGTRSPRLSRYGRALASQSPRRLYDLDAAARRLPHDFRPCVPDLERLPYEDWRRALSRTAHHLPARELDYADPAGHPALREAIARYLGRARGFSCRPDEVLIVGGVAQALDLATRLFVEVGDSVLVEDPHYPGARRCFEAAGARLLGAPVDDEGLVLSRLAEKDLERCRLAYVTPSHQFPTGVILSLARRLELLEWAARTNAYVLEDDYDSEFRYAGRAIPSLKSLDQVGRVLYVGTFSKTLLPALRIAYLVLPAELTPVFRTARWLADWSAPSFEQVALARLIESGDFERHLRRARTLYSTNRRAMVEAIERELAIFAPSYHDSQAGLHLLLRLGDRPAGEAPGLIEAARARGLGLYSSAPCYLASGPGAGPAALELVMGFARLEVAAIDRGLAELRGLLADCAGRPVQQAGDTSA